MTPTLHLWLIPVLPLIGAAINGLLGKRFSRQAVAAVALAFCGAAFAMALWIALRFSSLTVPLTEYVAPWIRAGSFQADFAFYLDQLSLVMMLVVKFHGQEYARYQREVSQIIPLPPRKESGILSME